MRRAILLLCMALFAADAALAQAPAAANDPAAMRRANRERLQKDLDAAREKLAAARKALDEKQEPQEDERQIVLRTNTAGMNPGSRANCRVEERAKKKVTICPVSMPTDAYYDRIARLEKAVKDAEEVVADAERAYRRGTD
jgi:flagellar motility protein MotE (MotC chaperone)